MNIEDLPDDSDSSDEDYVPGNKPEDLPSEVESDGDTEEDSTDEDDAVKGKKRKRKTRKGKKKLKKAEKSVPEECEKPEPCAEEPEEEKKENIDDIWADFMKDTGFQSKSSVTQTSKSSEPKTNSVARKLSDDKNEPSNKKQDKVKITQVFEFAGEEVTVEKEVPVDSAEARLLSKDSDSDSSKNVRPKRTGLSGIGSVLSQLGKKPKISTLEKTKLDWDRFKKEENIEEELQTYNKGKDGFLERQDFLQRADLRRFEIEREVRAIERSKRLNNT